jgi:hypothetical protein
LTGRQGSRTPRLTIAAQVSADTRREQTKFRLIDGSQVDFIG